jgi:hypothetical protein
MVTQTAGDQAISDGLNYYDLPAVGKDRRAPRDEVDKVLSFLTRSSIRTERSFY